jgi:putative heme-binding domain-containing protein
MRAIGRVGTFLLLPCLPLAAQHGSTAATNPYTGPEHRAAGAKLYRAQCASCHGPEGTGTSAGPDLAGGPLRHGSSDDALFGVISKGVPGTSMPAFPLDGRQTWQLITHIRTLRVGRSAALAKGDAKAGARVFAAAGCRNCHFAGGEGGFTGPDLAEAASLRTLDELRTAVLDPNAQVPSAFWSVAVKLKSGQELRGIRLNEDTHSLQLRASGGRLVSVLKSDVASAEIGRNSPMPSFKNKLAGADLENLLTYLSTLGRQER